MHLIIKGKNIEITPALRRYAKEKIIKLQKYFDHIIQGEVEFSVEKNKTQKLEVTIHASGKVVRGVESTENMYSSIDKVVEKLERQLKKYKDKLRKHKEANRKLPVSPEGFKTLEYKEERGVVKVKRFAIKPMDPEEAVMQMNLLDHNFFVFLNSQSEEVNVIYKRKDGGYGLIEPEF